MRRARLSAVALLGGLLAAAADGQAPPPAPPAKPAAPTAPPPAGKDDTAKEKPKPVEWPKEIGGRDASAFIKDLDHPDPAVRCNALQTLPQFGPDARTAATKAVNKFVTAQLNDRAADTTVMVAAIDALGALAPLGTDNGPDQKESVRLLRVILPTAPSGGLYRSHAVAALTVFGHYAEIAVPELTNGDVVQDRSFETRRLVAAALAQVAMDEQKGPSPKALDALTLSFIKDKSVAVRMEAFQSLVFLGPPVRPRLGADAKKAPEINKEIVTARYMTPMKAQLAAEKDKQVEVWARLAVMRFDPDKELNNTNLVALAKLISTGDLGAKVHALNAIGLLGERAAKQLDAIVAELKNGNPAVVDAAVKALVSMGDKAKPALPSLKEALEARPEEYFKELLKAATKAIEEAKPSPGESESTTKDPPPAPVPVPKGPPGKGLGVPITEANPPRPKK